MLFLKAKQLFFRTNKVWAVVALLCWGLLVESRDLRYGILLFAMGLLIVWGMAAHPRADTPEAPYFARRSVRWTVTISAVIGLICLLFVAICCSSWRPPAG
jgi:hypothetical protein